MRSAEARAYVSAHPELAPAADRAAKVAALTAEKVFRHLDDPAAHPLRAMAAEGTLLFAADDSFQGSDSPMLASPPSPGDVVRRTVALEPLAHIRANHQAQVAWRFV